MADSHALFWVWAAAVSSSLSKVTPKWGIVTGNGLVAIMRLWCWLCVSLLLQTHSAPQLSAFWCMACSVHTAVCAPMSNLAKVRCS